MTRGFGLWRAGRGGAIPVVGDFNGDGQTDIASLVPGWVSEPQRGDVLVGLADTALTGEASPVPSQRTKNLPSQSHTGGVDGVYLKEVGGRVLAAEDERTQFDPASSIEATVLLHGLLDVLNVNPATGAPYRRLDDVVPVPANRNGSCPVQDGMFVDRTLEDAARLMMWNSTNEDTQGLRQLFGAPNLDRTIAAVGMASTAYTGVVGCAANKTTLQDLGRLYESVARGVLEGRRADWNRLAINVPILEIDPIIDGQAALRGLPADFRSRYRARLVATYKGGSGGNSLGQLRAVAGLMSLPFCTGPAVVDHSYVYGVFFDNASSVAPDPGGSGEFNLSRIVAEMLRQEIVRSVRSFAEGGCTP